MNSVKEDFCATQRNALLIEAVLSINYLIITRRASDPAPRIIKLPYPHSSCVE